MSGKPKLSATQVAAIRRVTKMTGVGAALRYGVAPSTISRIRHGFIWKRIGGAT